jgi:hypothetical protein
MMRQQEYWFVLFGLSVYGLEHPVGLLLEAKNTA